VLAAQRHLDFSTVIVVATTAAIIGDNIGYLIGRHGGRRLLLRDGLAAIHRRRFLTDSEAFFRRRGSIVVFLGRWLPVLRFTAAPLAGTHRMQWPRFLLWNGLGGIHRRPVWSPTPAVGRRCRPLRERAHVFGDEVGREGHEVPGSFVAGRVDDVERGGVGDACEPDARDLPAA
jgi:hypothetical protein